MAVFSRLVWGEIDASLLFHIHDRQQFIEDHDRTELPDLHAVLDEALRIDREFGMEQTGVYGMELEITDDAGRTVLKVPVQERRRSPSLPPLAAGLAR